MKNYYFFIGQMNACTAITIDLIKKHKASYEIVPFDNSCNCYKADDKVEKAMQDGYTPVFIGMNYKFGKSFDYPYQSEYASPFCEVQKLFNDFECSRIQNFVLVYTMQPLLFLWSEQIPKLVISGASKAEIVEIQNLDEKARGYTPEMLKNIDALLEPFKYLSARSRGLIVLELKSETLDDQILIPILNRCFWLQRYLNVMVISKKMITYYGYRDIVDKLQEETGLACGFAHYNLLDVIGNLTPEDISKFKKIAETETKKKYKDFLL